MKKEIWQYILLIFFLFWGLLILFASFAFVYTYKRTCKGQAPKTPFLREEYKLNKDKNLNIRISTKDLDYIKQRSKKANLTITGYVTKCALNKKIYVYDGYKDFLTELRKIGANVNQIARACNSGKISNPNLVVFQRELKNIWQSLKSKPPKEI